MLRAMPCDLEVGMYDEAKVDDAVLALLHLKRVQGPWCVARVEELRLGRDKPAIRSWMDHRPAVQGEVRTAY